MDRARPRLLGAQEAEFAVVLAANAELVREPGAVAIASLIADFNSAMSFGSTSEKKRRAGKASSGGARPSSSASLGLNLHHVFGDVPFPQRDGARLDGAAEPPGIGEQRRQGAASP